MTAAQFMELADCPFCGSNAAMSILLDDDDECVLSAWVSCPCGIEIHECRTEAEAAMKWNCRAIPDHGGAARECCCAPIDYENLDEGGNVINPALTRPHMTGDVSTPTGGEK
jgi:hypothetical protein